MQGESLGLSIRSFVNSSICCVPSDSSRHPECLYVVCKVGQSCPLVETYDLQVFYDTPHDTSISCSTISNVDLASQLAIQIDPALNRNYKDTLLQTLLKFSDVFEDSLRHTNVIQHKIETGSSQSIRQYPRRLPCAYREQARTQVTGMLDQGVI